MNIYETTLEGIDKEGNEITLSTKDLKGKKTVLYFYPSDGTSGCTKEAQDFRDSMETISKYALVIGVSPDSLESHKKFRNDHDLNFTLLSDPEHKLAEFFGVWGEKDLYGKKIMGIIRSTFIIDEDGEIVKSFKNVSVDNHVDTIVNILKS